MGFFPPGCCCVAIIYRLYKVVKKIYSIHSEIMYGVNNNGNLLIRDTLRSHGLLASICPCWLFHVCKLAGRCAAELDLEDDWI